ncbi:MAG: PAS domain-containing sensor histidine kinase, partial [Christensenellales bacterium]
YQESTSHLEEVLHKSNNMLQEMVRKNLTYLHLYNGFLENTSNETEIQAYIEEAQQNTGFADFYFLTYDGNYMTVTGETGYLGLQTNLDEMLSDGKDIVMNTALPGKPQMLVFVCPETQGSYRGFAYDAVAIAYYNDEVLKLLDNSAFEGNASNYVIYPDGRVIIGDPSNRKETIYNFIAMLRDHSDLSEEQLLSLSDAFAQGSSGNLRVKLGDTSYYLVHSTAVRTGRCWDCAGRNRQCQSELWFHTVQIVSGMPLVLLVILLIMRKTMSPRRKNTEISYRDELFQSFR